MEVHILTVVHNTPADGYINTDVGAFSSEDEAKRVGEEYKKLPRKAGCFTTKFTIDDLVGASLTTIHEHEYDSFNVAHRKRERQEVLTTPVRTTQRIGHRFFADSTISAEDAESLCMEAYRSSLQPSPQTDTEVP